MAKLRVYSVATTKLEKVHRTVGQHLIAAKSGAEAEDYVRSLAEYRNEKDLEVVAERFKGLKYKMQGEVNHPIYLNRLYE